MKTLEVLFSPADFIALKQRKLGGAACVVFDVFRATSSIVSALANDAAAVIPVAEIADALTLRKKDPAILLAGERNGGRIPASLTGGTDFDLGNSPREFTKEKVAGRTIAMTTTNGTRALQACAHADAVLIGSFLNLRATADWILRRAPETLLLVCSGTFEQASYEDALGAGALCDLVLDAYAGDSGADSAKMARELFRAVRDRVSNAAASSRNGRRLRGIPELRDDVAFCLQRDVYDFVAELRDGKVAVLA